MVLLIDTNVLIDYLGHRKEFYDNARNVIKFCAQHDIDGYVAFHSIPNIWYVLRKEPRREIEFRTETPAIPQHNKRA